jgi:hypothetical protein
MTRAPFHLNEQIDWPDSDGNRVCGTVTTFSGTAKRQTLTVCCGDGQVRVVTVDLQRDGEIISASPDIAAARSVALEYLSRGSVVGLSETLLANALASALVAVTAPDRGVA